MLKNLREITGYVLRASDGEIGRCKDFLFDDRRWVVRHMVADTRKWLPGRQVLISPPALQSADWVRKQITVAASREQIAEGPALEEDAPVSRQYEQAWFDHFGLPYYWLGPEQWGFTPMPYPPTRRDADSIEHARSSDGDPHLRSAEEIQTYDVFASDAERVGTMHDLLLEDTSWAIPYLVVDTYLLLPGGKVIVPTDAVANIEWRGARVDLTIPSERLEAAPSYDSTPPIDASDADRLVTETPSHTATP